MRRIEAVTGKAAEEWIEEQKEVEGLKLKVQGEKEEKKKALNKKLNHFERPFFCLRPPFSPL